MGSSARQPGLGLQLTKVATAPSQCTMTTPGVSVDVRSPAAPVAEAVLGLLPVAVGVSVAPARARSTWSEDRTELSVISDAVTSAVAVAVTATAATTHTSGRTAGL